MYIQTDMSFTKVCINKSFRKDLLWVFEIGSHVALDSLKQLCVAED